jgi:hypothetical protein
LKFEFTEFGLGHAFYYVLSDATTI